MQGPFGLSFRMPITSISPTSTIPLVKSLSQATATIPFGLVSTIAFLASVPPVATTTFTP